MIVLPDISDDARMALVGRLTVLRKARRDTAQALRDILVPLLNAIEQKDKSWDVSGIPALVEQLNEITRAIEELG